MGWFKLLVVNLAIFATLLFGLETAGQLLYWLKNGRFLSQQPRVAPTYHSTLFERHPFLAARPRQSLTMTVRGKTVTTTERHTRWTGAPALDDRVIRVALVGGSTTFGTGVSDRESWPAMLQQRLGSRYAVVNYGVPGYSSAEGVVQMALLVPEIEPDILVFYQGWNDLKNYHEEGLGVDYYGHGMRQFDVLGMPLLPEPTVLEKWQSVSVLALLGQKVAQWIKPVAKPATVDARDEADPRVDRIYRRNLMSLKLLSERLGAHSLFVPQVVNYTLFNRLPGSTEWARHVRNDAMEPLMADLNNLMAGVCEPGESDCRFVKGILEAHWKVTDFVDFGHFSPVGGKKFVDIIAPLVREETASLLAARWAERPAAGIASRQ